MTYKLIPADGMNLNQIQSISKGIAASITNLSVCNLPTTEKHKVDTENPCLAKVLSQSTTKLSYFNLATTEKLKVDSTTTSVLLLQELSKLQ
jgi:hypothetical protein